LYCTCICVCVLYCILYIKWYHILFELTATYDHIITHKVSGWKPIEIEDELTMAKEDYNMYKQLLKKTRHDIKSNEIEIRLETEASIKKIHDKYSAAHKLLIEKESVAVKEVKSIEEVFMSAIAKQKLIGRFIEKELVACGEKIVAIKKTQQLLSNAGVAERGVMKLVEHTTECEACDMNQIVGCRQRLKIVKGKNAWII